MDRSWHLGTLASTIMLCGFLSTSAQTPPIQTIAVDERPAHIFLNGAENGGDFSTPERKPGTSNSLSLNNLGVLLARDGKYDEAVRVLVQAAELSPDLYQAHRNLSIVYENLKRPADSLAEARLAVKAASSEPNALMQWCEVAFAFLEDASEAVICYERLKAVSPLDAASGGQYGIALYKVDRFNDAVVVLEKACADLPKNAELMNALGLTYFEKKNYKTAADRFKRAVEIDPDRGSFRYNLGLAYLATRNRIGALSQYRLLQGANSKFARKLYRVLYRHLVVSADELRDRRK